MHPIEKMYEQAKAIYASYGINTDEALKKLSQVNISIHCWQGDDVKGFMSNEKLSGGIEVTGNYPYKAHTADELREDLNQALKLLSGSFNLNLHAMYAEADQKTKLEDIEPHHFDRWIAWAKDKNLGLDFNPTCFSHPKASSGFTLSNQDEGVRTFWINHVKKSRDISQYFYKKLGKKSICNVWIPDGYKDFPYDRVSPRQRLKDSLDEIYKEKKVGVIDTLESKLFGIGSEAYTVGSHEFYLAYAQNKDLSICLDSGHFHPTELVSDKVAALSIFFNELLLHVSRPMRWDSDHVVIQDDALFSMMEVVVRNDLLSRVHIGLDYFDASINRVAAWVIGVRSTQKALLRALLEPISLLKEVESLGNYTKRLALLEELKSLPFGIIYDYYCYINHVPIGKEWLSNIEDYENEVKGKRNQ